jgi:PAS domain S-box-containing protein
LAPQVSAEVHAAVEREGRWLGEVPCLRKDGSQGVCETVVVPVRDEQERVVACISVNRDISERKHAEEALRASERRYRSLFGNSPLPMWVYDVESLAFLDVNEAAVAHYGYSQDEFLTMTIEDIRLATDAAVPSERVRQPASGLATPELCRHLKKGGTIIDVEVTSHAIQFAGRQARLALANDVSTRLRIEGEIRRLNEELERRVIERTAQLEATNRELETFGYSVSHDLRAPLRSIDGFSQALMEDHGDRLDTQAQDYLRRICGATQRMAELIDASALTRDACGAAA